MSECTADPAPLGTPDRRAAFVGTGLVLLLLVGGLLWAKWLPYADKTHTLLGTRAWDGSSLLDAGGSTVSLAGAWEFATAYATAIWKALVVSLLVAAGVDALVPRRWLARVLATGGPWRQATSGGLAAVPSMMCTCCTAPVTVGLRRSGVPLPAAAAYWVGNPLLNPAVLVFLFLVAPWQWGLTRLVMGAVLVLATGVLVAWTSRTRVVATAAPAPSDVRADEPADPTLRELPGRYLRSLLRLSLVLVPEYAVVVLAVGALSGWLSRFGALEGRLGLLAVLVAAAVGTLLVIPTGGEIPVLLGLSAVGAGAGLLGVLLVVLPALSLPSMVMVGRALTPRATAVAAGVVMVGGLVAGGLLAVLT